MRSLTGSLLSLALIAAPVPLPAQGSVAPRPRGGAEFGIPLASFLVPGLGQYLEGSWLAGAGFTATAAGGYALYLTGDAGAYSADELPRTAGGQSACIGAQLAQAAGELSADDCFHRSLPLLQRVGKYDFVKTHESTASLLSAPFDLRMLK